MDQCFDLPAWTSASSQETVEPLKPDVMNPSPGRQLLQLFRMSLWDLGLLFIFIENFIFWQPTVLYLGSDLSDFSTEAFLFVCLCKAALDSLVKKDNFCLVTWFCLSAYSTILWFQLVPQETVFDSEWNTEVLYLQVTHNVPQMHGL